MTFWRWGRHSVIIDTRRESGKVSHMTFFVNFTTKGLEKLRFGKTKNVAHKGYMDFNFTKCHKGEVGV